MRWLLAIWPSTMLPMIAMRMKVQKLPVIHARTIAAGQMTPRATPIQSVPPDGAGTPASGVCVRKVLPAPNAGAARPVAPASADAQPRSNLKTAMLAIRFGQRRTT